MVLEKSFGEKIRGIEYKDRVGAYAIILDDKYNVAVIKTPTGYFLPGGGLEDDETHEDCIKRECLEEAGLSVVVNEFICKGDKYHWSDTLEYYMHGIGYFYFAKVLENVSKPIEKDHELVWLNKKDCYENLFLEHQAWAVYQYFLLNS